MVDAVFGVEELLEGVHVVFLETENVLYAGFEDDTLLVHGVLHLAAHLPHPLIHSHLLLPITTTLPTVSLDQILQQFKR